METYQYSDASVAFTVGPSAWLAAFIVLAAALTTAVMVAMPLPSWATGMSLGWCAALFGSAITRYLRAHDVRITGGTAITVDELRGTVVSGSFVAPWLTIIHWRGQC